MHYWLSPTLDYKLPDSLSVLLSCQNKCLSNWVLEEWRSLCWIIVQGFLSSGGCLLTRADMCQLGYISNQDNEQTRFSSCRLLLACCQELIAWPGWEMSESQCRRGQDKMWGFFGSVSWPKRIFGSCLKQEKQRTARNCLFPCRRQKVFRPRNLRSKKKDSGAQVRTLKHFILMTFLWPRRHLIKCYWKMRHCHVA